MGWIELTIERKPGKPANPEVERFVTEVNSACGLEKRLADECTKDRDEDRQQDGVYR